MMERLSFLKSENEISFDYSTIGKILEKSKVENKGKVFIIAREEERSVTFEELVEEADHLASGLLGIGLKQSERIGIIINNSVEAFVINFACAKGGFVSVNLNPALQHRELEYCIKTAKLNCIICLDKYKIFNVLDILRRVAPEIDEAYDRVKSENVPSLKHVIVVSKNKYKGTSNLESIKSLGKKAPRGIIQMHQDNVKCEDLLTILFTSGTTGNPKAVGLTHFQLNNATNLLGLRLGQHENSSKMCFVLPMFHIFGLGFSTLFARFGSTLVLPALYYNPEKTLEAISEEKCTDMIGTPTMYGDLVAMQKQKNLNLFLKNAHCGGAPGTKQLYRDIVDILKVEHVKIGYGTTETLVLSWPRVDDDFDEKSNCVGYLIENLEAKIVDQDGKIVPVGTTGDLHVRGFSVIDKYIIGGLDSFDEGGWFKTGDAIYCDDDGKLYIAGRLKEIINRGGEKISPAEVEEILETHKDILEAQVVGSPHDRLGEEVCACLRLKPYSSITLDEIKTFCKGKLSYYKIPSRIEILNEFPKTALGKIQKSKLVEKIKSAKI